MSHTINIKERIENWIQTNKCWRREFNIDHAKYEIARAIAAHDDSERAFWELILERLEGDYDYQ